MAKVGTEVKAALLASGEWADFLLYRSNLVSKGEKPAEANRMAVVKFLGDDALSIAQEPKSKVKVDPKLRRVKSKLKAESLTQAVSSGMIGAMPAPPAPVPMSSFDCKADVTETENVRWVCDNLRNPEVSPSGCPSMRAWNFLCECRESPLFRMNFLKDHYGKLVVRKTSQEDNDVQEYDGAVTVDLIIRLQEFKSRAVVEGASRVHAPGGAGSSPAPATSVIGQRGGG